MLAALAVVALGVSADRRASAGENWTRFRGPNGSGVATESFPAEWTEEDYLWKVTLPGKGHSSPIGWGDLAFVTYGDPKTGAVIDWIDISRLTRKLRLTNYDAVPNGIAYDAKSDRLFVTGKYWPKLFEIRLKR